MTVASAINNEATSYTPYLTKEDIRVMNAKENLKGSPVVYRQKIGVRKSFLDKELMLHKITKLEQVCTDTHQQILSCAEDISSKWSEVKLALENYKDAVDLNNFITYDELDQLYIKFLVACRAYKASVQKAKDNLDNYVLSVKAIVPRYEKD